MPAPLQRRRRALSRHRWLVLLAASFLLVLVTGFEIALVPTASMEGTILVGDHLLIDKVAYGPTIPLLGVRLPAIKRVRRGDIVSIRVPAHEFVLVKRVVALGGDRVEMRDGVLYVNSTRVPEPYAALGARGSMALTVVPADAVFVLGDNRDNSEDSRQFGPVTAANVVGEPVLICWSFAISGSDWLDALGQVRPQAYTAVLGDLLAKTRWRRSGRFLR